MREGRRKDLAVDSSEYLFDVVADSRERANLAVRRPEQQADIRRRYEGRIATMPGIPADAHAEMGFDGRLLPRLAH
jgi:hypothetical protein